MLKERERSSEGGWTKMGIFCSKRCKFEHITVLWIYFPGNSKDSSPLILPLRRSSYKRKENFSWLLQQEGMLEYVVIELSKTS